MICFFLSSFTLSNFHSEPLKAFFPSYFSFFLPLAASYLTLYLKSFLNFLQFSLLFCLPTLPYYMISQTLRSFSCFQPIFLPHSDQCTCLFSLPHSLTISPSPSPPTLCSLLVFLLASFLSQLFSKSI